jgi:hypothetical protein
VTEGRKKRNIGVARYGWQFINSNVCNSNNNMGKKVTVSKKTQKAKRRPATEQDDRI